MYLRETERSRAQSRALVMKRGRERRDDGGEGPRFRLRMTAEWNDGGGGRKSIRRNGMRRKEGEERRKKTNYKWEGVDERK